jgi:hypothetical protein
MDGRVAVKGGCEKCTALCDIHAHHIQMLSLMRGFSPPPKAKRRPVKTANLQENLFGEF